jgi:exodeoxyribonuclease VII small subunit
MSPRKTTSPKTDLEQEDAGAATPASADSPDVAADGGGTVPEQTPLPEDIATLSYEAARDQLVEVVRRLESGSGGLEEFIVLWERGEMLARRCQQWLDGAREKLDEAVAQRR